jgi:hypothetical protein
MRYFQTTVQRALDRACRLPTSLRPTWRWPLAFGTAAALIVSALGPSTPAVAEGPIVRDHRDPFARVQLVINRIIVHDDSDWGNGEIAINFEVISSRPGCGSPDCGTTLLRGGRHVVLETHGT